jgi:phage-related protein
MDTYLNAIQSYVDAVSSTVSNIENMIKSSAKKIAKYMKVIFDKMMEFVLKQINVVMSKVIGALPATLTSKFGDLKETINEMILMMYNKMFDGLADQLAQTLMDTLQPAKREQEAREFAANARSSGSSNTSGSDDGSLPGRFQTKPKVPMCYAESIASTVISKNKNQITESNTNVISSLNGYIDGIQGDIDSVSATISQGQELISGGLGDSLGDFGATAATVTGGMDGMLNMMPDISSSLGAALEFSNIIANVFPGELTPKKAINDFYQLATGGSGAAAAELPSMASLGNSVSSSSDARNEQFTTPPAPPEFVTPSKGKPPVSTTAEEVDVVRRVDNSTFDLGDGSTFTLAGS